MKKVLMLFLLMLFSFQFANAQEKPNGKDLGFGIILGDPTGLTLKYWTNRENALAFSLGNSYFGNLRVGVDYLWHFDAFNSRVVNLYAGPGAVIGFGEGKGIWYKENREKFYYRDEGIGLAVRGIFGINVVPERTPFELFFEIGALVGIAPDFGSAPDVAVGARFYP